MSDEAKVIVSLFVCIAVTLCVVAVSCSRGVTECVKAGGSWDGREHSCNRK